MTAFHPTPQSFIKNQQKQQQLPRKGYRTWISLGDEETNMKQDESVQLRGHNIRNTIMLPSTVTKRTNRLHNLVRTAPKINAFSPNKAGKPLRKHLISTKLLSTRRLTDHDESMSRPLLPLTTSFDSTKVNAMIISIGGPLDTYFERIDKVRKSCPVASDRVGNERGVNEIYRTACSTGMDILSQRRSRSTNRHHLDFFDISQEISLIGQAVVPWKTCLKSEIVHIPSLKVPQRDPMLEISCKKPYKVEVIPRKQRNTIDPEMDSQKVSKTERKQKKRRFLKVPEGFAAQINVMTGLVDLLCVDPSQIAPKVEFIPELTRCTQVCIPMSATALISPRSFEVGSVQMRNSAA